MLVLIITCRHNYSANLLVSNLSSRLSGDLLRFLVRRPRRLRRTMGSEDENECRRCSSFASRIHSLSLSIGPGNEVTDVRAKTDFFAFSLTPTR